MEHVIINFSKILVYIYLSIYTRCWPYLMTIGTGALLRRMTHCVMQNEPREKSVTFGSDSKIYEFDYHRPDRLYSLIDYSNHLSVFSRVLPTNTCILIFLYKKKTERVCLRYMWGSLFIARRLCHQAGTTHRSLHFILKEKKIKVNCCRVSTLSRIRIRSLSVGWHLARELSARNWPSLWVDWMIRCTIFFSTSGSSSSPVSEWADSSSLSELVGIWIIDNYEA